MTKDFELVFYLLISFSSLSIVCCLILILLYYTIKPLQLHSLSLVKNLAFFNIWYCTTGFYIPSDAVSCQVQAFSISSGSLLILLWTTVISFALYKKIVLSQSFRGKTYNRRSLVLVIGITIVVYLLPYIQTQFKSNAYGKQGYWCWIDVGNEQTDNIWEICVFYVPLCTLFVLNGVFIVKILRTLKIETLLNNSVLPVSENTIKVRLWLYPCVTLFAFLPCGISRLFNILGQSIFGLNVACAVCSPSCGILTFLVFVANPTVRTQITTKFCKPRLGLQEESGQGVAMLTAGDLQ